MNEKQRETILFAFKSINEIHGKTFIQKLFYLFNMEIFGGSELFEYFPYNYGPFSKELNQSVNELIDGGFLEERKMGNYFLYAITEKGKKSACNHKHLNSNEIKNIKMMCKHVKSFTPKKLLEYVYRKYPETTVNSLLRK